MTSSSDSSCEKSAKREYRSEGLKDSGGEGSGESVGK